MAENVIFEIETTGNYDIELIALKIMKNLTHTTYTTNESASNT